MQTFKVLAALLTYPEADHKAAADEMAATVKAEDLLAGPHLAAVHRFVKEMKDTDLMDLQARYVGLFDRSRALSLHLFEHVHGESRDRGQAMVDLRALYERHGLSPTRRELPDFLPLFLEFLSLLPVDEARGHLAEAAHIVTALWERMARHDSSYAGVLRAVASLAAAEPDRQAVDTVKAATDAAARDEADVDGSWQEAAVTFGPSCAGHSKPSCGS
jgi:nitrate reductase delta subunit